MKTSVLITFVCIICGFDGFGQNICDIQNHYQDFIMVQKTKYETHEYITKNVIMCKRKSCFSELINNNEMFINHLFITFSSDSIDKKLLAIKDTTLLQKIYFENLKNDSLFSSIMNNLVSKTISKQKAKDTVSLDQLLNIAVKYFAINKLNEQGYYVGKVCGGQNQISTIEKKREPFLEAFCLSMILKHFESQEYNLYNEFVKSIKEVYKVNLGPDRQEKLLRAQGAIFMLMRNNKTLRKMLLKEYKNHQKFLPFVLVNK